MNASAPSRRFGRYELQEELGRGGMGVVYRAIQADTGREVALKVLHGAGALDEADQKRFEREAHLAARVRHPGVVQVVDAGRERGFPFVAFELVRGRSLDKLDLDLERHVTVLAKVARAIGAAHVVKVVHRDLKPSNVIVEEATVEPRVVDFGLAFDGRLELSRLSRTGEVLGTPAYMAPETVRGRANPQDPRLDVYALGVMLYEKLLGRHPFRGLTTQQTLERVARGFPSLVGREDGDDALARIADRALAVDPAQRYPDGDAFAIDLEGWLAGRHDLGRSARGNRLPVVAGALVLVAGLAVTGAWLGTRSAPPSPPQPPTPPARPSPPAPPPAPAYAPPKTRRRPKAKPPERVAPPEVVDELDEVVDQIAFAPSALERAARMTEQLARDYPDDARSLHFGALALFMLEGRELEGCRGLIRATHGAPALEIRATARAVYFLRQLGRERAAASLASEVYPRDDDVPPRLGGVLAFLYATAAPPLADPERAERIATRTIETTKDLRDQFSLFQVHATRAQARISLGKVALAANDFETAARLSAKGTFPAAARIYAERAELCAKGDLPREHGPRAFYLNFPATKYQTDIESCNEKWRRWEAGGDEDAARAFQELAESERAAGRSEHAAIAMLRAGWALDRARAPEAARAAYEKARELAQESPLDTRALIARALAFHLVERALAPERAEELALEAAAEPDETDARTWDEIAEAWSLVARARLQKKDREGARRALAEAEAYLPTDKRLVESVRAAMR